VLAVGSNASVAQMQHKYVQEPRRFAYPQFFAAVTGLDVGYAPMVAGYGAVPATAVPHPGATAQIAVQYLDETAVALLDATEGGYDRVRLSPSQGVQVVLPNGDSLDCVDVYVARGGYLGDSGGPWLLGSGPGRLDQRAVMARLLDETIANGQDVDGLVGELVAVPDEPELTADGTQLAELLRRGIDQLGCSTPSPYLDSSLHHKGDV